MATNPTPSVTDFTRDVLGRYICNGLDEALHSADPSIPNTRPFDVIIVGGGTFGSAFAQHLFFRDKQHSHRILVLEGGPFMLPEHVQNLPMLGINAAAATSIADLRQAGQFGPDKPQTEVWGLPWHSPVKFPGLAYCVGGRSVFWGGWSPQLLVSELLPTQWPASLVNDLNARYFGESATQIGVDRTNDFISGDLHSALRQLLFDAISANKVSDAIALAQIPLHLDPSQIPAGQEDINKLEAPLAVQTNTRPGFFPFNKFSAVPLLMSAARASATEAGFDDVKRRLMVVPRCHVKRLMTMQDGSTSRVTSVETDQGTIALPANGMVIIALATVESTRLALNSFQSIPGYSDIGKNLMAHLRSNLDIRIPREALPGTLSNELQASALFVKCRHTHADGSVGHFHFQITASGLGPMGTDSEAELFKKVPDIDGFEVFRSANDKSVVITIRGVGEMEPMNPNNSVRLDAELDESLVPRAFVAISPSAKDNLLWDAMDKAANDIANIFANGKPLTILGKRRDGLGTTHHEAGTLRMSDDAAKGVTNLDGRFHQVPNVYAVGPALFPTIGSPNPMLTGIALVRRTVDQLVPAVPPPEAGFNYLFDGTESTFKRWQVAGSCMFDLVDGAMVAQPGNDLGLFYFSQGFGDFILRLQFRLDRIDDNSGVFVRFRNPRLPVPRRNDPSVSDLYMNQAYVGVDTGFEIQIDELARGNKSKNPPEPDGMDKKRTGAIYDIPTTPGGGIQQKYQQGMPLQPGQWNDYEIQVKKSVGGAIISVRLNGQQTTTYTNTDNYRGQSILVDPNGGFIGLQAHSGRVAFRNIRLKTI